MSDTLKIWLGGLFIGLAVGFVIGSVLN